jgi:multiple sugar transport system permease protein
MNEYSIFARVMAPLVAPGMMTLAIFHLMNNWNDLLYPLMMTNSTKMRTLSAGLALFVGERATTYFGPQIAGALISITPLLVLYIFFQKYFVASIANTGLKD